jgi:hypothetical protein
MNKKKMKKNKVKKQKVKKKKVKKKEVKMNGINLEVSIINFTKKNMNGNNMKKYLKFFLAS